MGYFGTAWKAASESAWSDALSLRVYIRTNDPTPVVFELTDGENVLACSTIKREREREFGVIQGQSCTIEATNGGLLNREYQLVDGWMKVVGVYPGSVEAILHVGRIRDARASGRGTITIETGDILVDMMDAKLPRDIYFRDTAWAGAVKTVSIDDASSDYDNDASGAGVTITIPAGVIDHNARIVFTSATAFKVVLEDGDESQTGVIGSDLAVDLESGAGLYPVTINQEGWDKTTGAYTAGDEFEFATARARAASELTPINTLVVLNKSKVYDFDLDMMVSPNYDALRWAGYATATADVTVGGFWERGTPIVDMMQEILPLIHATLYPMPNGKIGIWMLEPSSEITVRLNGDPSLGEVNILDHPEEHLSSMDRVYNRVIYRYKRLGTGEDASVEYKDEDSPFDTDRVLEISSRWEANPVAVAAGCSRALNRFKRRSRFFTIPATMAGAVGDIGELAAINDSSIGATAEQACIVSVEIDPMADGSLVTAEPEEIVGLRYMRIGPEGDPDTWQVGDEGDPGAAMCW